MTVIIQARDEAYSRSCLGPKEMQTSRQIGESCQILRTELRQLYIYDAFIGTGKSVGGSGHLSLI